MNVSLHKARHLAENLIQLQSELMLLKSRLDKGL
jgi:hypothetical protein